MDEKDIKEILSAQNMPEPSDFDLRRAMDGAWERRQDKNQKKRPVSYHAAVVTLSVCILVATFSYAVTQSTRSGSGDASSETNLMNSIQLSQYPAGVRTSVVRMVIGGTNAESLRFNPPEQLATLDSPSIGVFHPQGGGSVYQSSPADVMADGQPGTWFYNMEINIDGVGTEASDMIAFMPGLTETVCRKLNQEIGIPDVPVMDAALSASYMKQMIDDGVKDYTPPARPVQVLAMHGQPFGCFQTGVGGPYVYYHVIIER